MKIKKIETILKASKHIIVINGSDCQWISDGVGYYPLYGMPELTQETSLTMFDIPQDKWGEYKCEETHCFPAGYDFRDTQPDELPAGRIPILFTFTNMELVPIATTNGIIYAEKQYFVPLRDPAVGGYDLYTRMSAAGDEYIAVKRGMALTAVIMPFKEIINEKFTKTLEEITMRTRLELAQNFERENGASGQLGMVDEEEDE